MTDDTFDISFTYQRFMLKATCTRIRDAENSTSTYLVTLATPNKDMYHLTYVHNTTTDKFENTAKDANVNTAILEEIGAQLATNVQTRKSE